MSLSGSGPIRLSRKFRFDADDDPNILVDDVVGVGVDVMRSVSTKLSSASSDISVLMTPLKTFAAASLPSESR